MRGRWERLATLEQLINTSLLRVVHYLLTNYNLFDSSKHTTKNWMIFASSKRERPLANVPVFFPAFRVGPRLCRQGMAQSLMLALSKLQRYRPCLFLPPRFWYHYYTYDLQTSLQTNHARAQAVDINIPLSRPSSEISSHTLSFIHTKVR